MDLDDRFLAEELASFGADRSREVSDIDGVGSPPPTSAAAQSSISAFQQLLNENNNHHHHGMVLPDAHDHGFRDGDGSELEQSVITREGLLDIQHQLDVLDTAQHGPLLILAKKLLSNSLLLDKLRTKESASHEHARTATLIDLQRSQLEYELLERQATVLSRKLAATQVALSQVSHSQFSPHHHHLHGSNHNPLAPVYVASPYPSGATPGGPPLAGGATSGLASVFGHSSHSASNNATEEAKLRSDLRYANRRLATAEAMVDRYGEQLRSLRSTLLLAAPLITVDSILEAPSPPLTPHDPTLRPVLSNDGAEGVVGSGGATVGGASAPERTSRKRPRPPAMGDAEAELLLLAGKQRSHIRRIHRVTVDQAIQEKAREILEFDVGPASPPTPRAGLASTHAPATTVEKGAHFGTGRGRADPRDRQHGIDEEGGSDTEEEDAERTPPLFPMDIDPAHSYGVGANYSHPDGPPSTPPKQRRIPPGPSRGGSPTKLVKSAHLSSQQPSPGLTDLLHAATSLLPVAPQSPTKRKKYNPNTSGSNAIAGPSSAALRAITTDEEASAGGSGPENTDVDADGEVGGKAEGEYESAFNALGLLADQADQATKERKVKRSPYVKWNVGEDEQLVHAVIACGQRWDQVAAQVPTRSYHQCRQRWLRGLRSGDTLPDELLHLKDRVKEAVRIYESARGKHREKVEIGTPNEDDDAL